MTFSSRSAVFGMLLACSMGCAHNRKSATEVAKAPQLSPAEMEQLWIKASSPSDAHKRLEWLVGTFKTESKFWQAPGTDPEVTHGTSKNEALYGGRFVQQSYRGSWNGQPFEGTGYVGYDNVIQRYQSTWLDSMSTQVMHSSGTLNPANNTIAFSGTSSCPLTGGEKSTNSVLTLADKDHHRFEMFDATPDGAQFKVLEISYTRSGGAHGAKKAKLSKSKAKK